MIDREEVAAYLLDRADQYATKDPCWIALADAAHALMDGTFDDVASAGELEDADLLRRVRGFRETAEKVRRTERARLAETEGT